MAIYRLYPEAERDLERIWRYTAATWGLDQASRYLDDLLGTFQILADTPLISPIRQEFAPPVRIHHHAHHLVVYLLSPEGSDAGIDIVRVLHESMDTENQLGD